MSKDAHSRYKLLGLCDWRADTCLNREELREQHAIGEEISEAIGQPMGQTLDEDELDEELAELQQEELDNKMLETGQVPVTDKVSRLPTGPQGERKWKVHVCEQDVIELTQLSPRQEGRPCRRRGRGRGAAEVTSRDGHVIVISSQTVPLAILPSLP